MLLQKIVIPSFKRATILKNNTLTLLNNHNVPKDLIDIVVETEDMAKEYKKICGDYNYIISSTKGICEKRNFVRYHYYTETKSKYLFSIDDDIQQLLNVNNEMPNILTVIEKGFKETQKNNLNYWGINELHNTFYMKNSPPVTTSLKYVAGAFQGIIIDRSKDIIYSDVDHGEDYQFSMEHYLRDNGILRLNHYYLKTPYFIEHGGICESIGGLVARKINMEENAIYLKERYGDMCKIKELDYGKDIRLNGRYKNVEI